MKRKKIVIGNWKMHKTIADAVSFTSILKEKKDYGEVQVGLSVPFTAISAVASTLDGSRILVGAQNMSSEEKGAFTGEISDEMLVDAGASFVLIGHSERRHIFGESLELIHKKIVRALSSPLMPILCVGESGDERKSSKHFEVVKSQIFTALEGISDLKDLCIAYEPVWAIGTGLTASADDAQEMHAFIRAILKEKFSNSCSLLYGGSAKPENAKQLMDEPDIDGLLVGGASLKIEMFVEILRSVTIP